MNTTQCGDTAIHPPHDSCPGLDGTEVPLRFCRECAEGKHPNCNGQAWDNEADTFTDCTCPDAIHDAL